MTLERFAKFNAVLQKRQLDLTIITDQVHKGRNLAALVRNCDAIGIDTIHTVMPQAGFQPYRGTAMGSQKWVNIDFHDSVTDAIGSARDQQMQVLAAHLSQDAVDYREIDYTVPTALVLGTEKQGVSESALALVDQAITIPMVGMAGSLNVSVACGIILSEAYHQRFKAGLYERCQLSKQEFARRLFEWMQPDIASYCKENGLDYPALDEEGDLANPSQWYQDIRKQGK